MATHRMSFYSLKQSLISIYLMRDHGILRDISFGSRPDLGQKYCQNLGYKPNPSIPIIFDRFLKNRPPAL